VLFEDRPRAESFGTAAELYDRVRHSDHRTLPAPRRQRLLAAVGEAIEGGGGSLEVPYETVLVTARRIWRSRRLGVRRR
jgi:hypothetical protein